jgi:nucleoside-diphosphate kinase
MAWTLAMVKPDAVSAGKTGDILAHLEREGLRISALRMTRLSRVQAEAFYAVHRDRPFFESLASFMCSGPVVSVVLESEGAVERLRATIGATDPAEAEPGTVRALFAESKERNAIHASDSDQNASREIDFFFPVGVGLAL